VAAPHLETIRAQVGLLFQDPDDQLFCPTVWEDVAFGPQQLGWRGTELTTRVSRALEQVGLAGFEERLPHHLSRGEKRRVCLAGLLACEARVLALDEPTSELDPRGRRELKALLKDLPIAQIIATHDLEFVVEICPRVLVLDDGKIVAEGPTAELLSDEPLMLAHGLERPHILRHLHPH
jgi:cobalt/nickel transport system ATP-binding protein